MLLKHRVFRTFVFALAGCVLVFYVVGFMLSDRWDARSERVLAAPPARVQALVTDLWTWPEWSGWRIEGSDEVELEQRGEQRKVGQEIAWLEGQGEIVLRLTAVEDGRVEYRFLVKPPGDAKARTVGEGDVAWSAAGEGTRVVWHDGGELEVLVHRWQAWFGSLQSRVQGQQALSLDGLERAVAPK